MPAVQRLRELEPTAFIAMLCKQPLAELWRHNPFLDEVIPFAASPDIGALQAAKFDIAIIFPNSFRAAWEAKRIGIPARVGRSGHSRRWLLTEVVPEPKTERPVYRRVEVDRTKFKVKRFPQARHQVHHYLDLVAHLGGNPKPVPPKIHIAVEEMPQLTKFFHDDGLPCIGINAGAAYGPAKRWPAERFAAVAEQIAQHYDCRWILLGGGGDLEVATAIEQGLLQADIPTKEIVNVAGKTSLHDLFLLLKMCSVLITNDSGPMHVAAALGTPLVAIFGSTSAELTGPLGPQSVVVQDKPSCSPCFLRECPIDMRCMTRVTADQVVREVLKLCSGERTGGFTIGTANRLRPGWQFSR
jgi:heptosyltransferase-2